MLGSCAKACLPATFVMLAPYNRQRIPLDKSWGEKPRLKWHVKEELEGDMLKFYLSLHWGWTVMGTSRCHYKHSQNSQGFPFLPLLTELE